MVGRVTGFRLGQRNVFSKSTHNLQPDREVRQISTKASQTWWKRAVFYQIYPRSFQDTTHSGVGDLPGITAHLDHLRGGPKSLGIDAIWLSPFYPSPMKDFGYDVSGYTDVDPRFGTMDDFRTLVREAHRRGIRIIIDLVLNHSSDQHPWFQAARRDRRDPHHDWYIWHPGLPRRIRLLRRWLRPRRPNNWLSMFEVRNAWRWNEATREYYLGTFTRHQPEFNWRNHELRTAMYEVMRFWLDEGVDGFRLDVINWFVKDDAFRNNPRSWRIYPDLLQRHIYDRNRPETHEICREMRRLADSYGDRLLVGEVFHDDPKLASSYHGKENEELHLAFNFEFLFQPWSARRFARAAKRWYDVLPPGAWPNFTLSNHDQKRHISRYSFGRHTEARARIAAAMLLTVKGTPFLYYGEEIGMRNSPIRKQHLRDPLGRRTWPFPFGRDGERTPMQWSGKTHSGFTKAVPWLPVHPDYAERNVAAQREDPNSLLNFYRELIALRSNSPALLEGRFILLNEGKHNVLAYERGAGDERVIVVLNFADRSRHTSFPVPEHNLSVLFGTHRRRGEVIQPNNRRSHLRLAGHEVLLLSPQQAERPHE